MPDPEVIGITTGLGGLVLATLGFIIRKLMSNGNGAHAATPSSDAADPIGPSLARAVDRLSDSIDSNTARLETSINANTEATQTFRRESGIEHMEIRTMLKPSGGD